MEVDVLKVSKFLPMHMDLGFKVHVLYEFGHNNFIDLNARWVQTYRQTFCKHHFLVSRGPVKWILLLNTQNLFLSDQYTFSIICYM